MGVLTTTANTTMQRSNLCLINKDGLSFMIDINLCKQRPCGKPIQSKPVIIFLASPDLSSRMAQASHAVD